MAKTKKTQRTPSAEWRMARGLANWNPRLFYLGDKTSGQWAEVALLPDGGWAPFIRQRNADGSVSMRSVGYSTTQVDAQLAAEDAMSSARC